MRWSRTALPPATIEIDTEQHGATVRLSTRGLAARGRRELVLVGAPSTLAFEARELVRFVAEYVVNTPIADGETMATPHEAGLLAVRLVGADGGRQRIVDGWDESDSVPWIALTTMICWGAHAAVSAGRVDLAIEKLEMSLRWSPIAPGKAPRPHGLPYNWNGAVAVLILVQLDPRRKLHWLDELARRDPELAQTGDRSGAAAPATTDDQRAIVEKFSEGAPLVEAIPDPRLGPQYLERGMFGEALFSANLMIDADPTLAIAWRVRGEALFGLGRHRQALEAYERVATLGGSAANGTAGCRVACLMELGEIAAAVALLDERLTTPGLADEERDSLIACRARIQVART